MLRLGWLINRVAATATVMGGLVASLATWPTMAQVSMDASLKSVVRLMAEIPPDSRTVRNLGSSRDGNGIVIDSSGLILTVGFLIVEAMSVLVSDADGKLVSAEIVAYDFDSGFGLVRATAPLRIDPIALGDSDAIKPKDAMLAVGHGGSSDTVGTYVMARREFAGYWEYLLDDAIFTSPPHGNWGGAGLIGRDGKLYGVGYLFIANVASGEDRLPGNMFVPINRLKPILTDLLAEGRATGPRRPWLGMFTTEAFGHLVVERVTPFGPASKAGIEDGDVLLTIAGEPVGSLPDLYRKIWRLGEAGVEVPLRVFRQGVSYDITVKSASRYDFLRLRRSY